MKKRNKINFERIETGIYIIVFTIIIIVQALRSFIPVFDDWMDEFLTQDILLSIISFLIINIYLKVLSISKTTKTQIESFDDAINVIFSQKKKFKEASNDKKEKFILAFKELDYYKDVLVKGVDDDAISYESVVDAFKSKDEDAINRALLTSAMVAYDIQDASLNAIYYIEKLIELGNKNLYSDLISAAILLAACNEMASLNVVANAKELKNEELKNEYLSKTEYSTKKAKQLKTKIIKIINNL